MVDEDKDAVIKKLKAEIETLQSIIFRMPGNVYWRDLEGRYLGCNKNVLDTFNMTSLDQFVGKTIYEIVDKDVAERLDKADSEVIKVKKEISIEESGPGYPHFLTKKTPLFDSQQNVIGMLGISIDISQRKEMEEKLRIAKQRAEASNQEKTRFLATISHELRTPLTSILGFARFLEKETIPDREKNEAIRHIVNAGFYLLTLVNNLLNYNKLEKSKLVLTIQPFDPKKMAEDVISMLLINARQKDIPLLLDFDPTIPKSLMGDKGALQQILMNLVGNAIKFTEKGHVLLRVKCLEVLSNTAKLYIAVEDTGIGIPQREQQAIFKRFHQVSNAYTRSSSLEGTGLGLAIIKKLIKLLDSKINVNSSPGKGSVFYFTLNLAIPEEEKANILAKEKESFVQHQQKSGELFPTHRLNALLVEDDALIQIIHRQMLEEIGCNVDIAGHARMALETIATKPYDILFVDIGLPDIDGFTLIESVRQKNKTIPIVAVTGYSEQEERDRCVSVGANEVLIKPVPIDLLRKAVDKYVN